MVEQTERRDLTHLERIQDDVRDEVKRRIDQRDKYVIQQIVSLAVVFGVAFSERGNPRLLLVAPLVSIYYTVLILYSYRVHAVMAEFLREGVEPEVARRAETPESCEWESYYHARGVRSGIRRAFFIGSLWVVVLGSVLALREAVEGDPGFQVWVERVGIGYLLVAVIVTAGFWRAVPGGQARGGRDGEDSR